MVGRSVDISTYNVEFYLTDKISDGWRDRNNNRKHTEPSTKLANAIRKMVARMKINDLGDPLNCCEVKADDPPNGSLSIICLLPTSL